MRSNKLKDRRGTALLVALLVMGVLIAVSLVLGSLIFRETRITKEFLDAGRAYYAAESGVEVALYGLNNNLPGWEPDTGDDEYKSILVDDAKLAVAEYRLKNRCKAYPCLDKDEFDIGSINNLDVSPNKVYYDVLELNRSITIPLFVAEEINNSGVKEIKTRPVTDFTVEFFAPFNPSKHLRFTDDGSDSSGSQNSDIIENLAGWDILRWKIFGINKDPQARVTESISDFTALSMMKGYGLDEAYIVATNASKPSWFGTVDCDSVDDGVDRYTSDIQCEPYYIGGASGEVQVDTENFGQLSAIEAGLCAHTEAREYYEYEYFGQEKALSAVNGCYPIRTFLMKHDLNYLTLTNLINPAVFHEDYFNQKNSLSKLFFRVELFTSDEVVNEDTGEISYSAPTGPGYTVREYADITANGYSGDSKQSINVKIKRGSFMPVFHFSLYSTYMSGSLESDGEVHNKAYWYGEDE